jgi:predicted DNA-binding protein
MFSERTQVLLSPEQLERVKRIARRDGTSVGAVIRDAIDAFVWAPEDRRQRAFEHLMSMNDGTSDDWDVMKAQIEASRYPPLPE